MDHLRSGVQDQPGQHGETLSLLKIQKKLAGCDGVHLLSQLRGRLRQDSLLNPEGRGCSEPRLHHCTPAWATEQDSISEKKKKKGICLQKISLVRLSDGVQGTQFSIFKVLASWKQPKPPVRGELRQLGHLYHGILGSM